MNGWLKVERSLFSLAATPHITACSYCHVSFCGSPQCSVTVKAECTSAILVPLCMYVLTLPQTLLPVTPMSTAVTQGLHTAVESARPKLSKSCPKQKRSGPSVYSRA